MSFGTQTYADETFGGSELAIGAIFPSRAGREGGTKIRLAGTFPINITYLVRVDGVLAYSGVPGQGTTIKSDGDNLTFVLPPFDISQIGSLVVEVETVPGGDKVQTTLNVVERAFGSASFELRKMFPPWYAAGPRRLELEPQEQ